MEAELPRPLLALEPEELALEVERGGGRPFHARVLRQAMLEKGMLDYEQMTSLPASLRSHLKAHVPLLGSRVVESRRSPDRTTKLLLAFPRPGGGEDTVETVHIPPHSPDDDRGATLCVSTQVGCPVGCPFCASGIGGLVRNLEPWEIVEQYLRGRELGPLRRSVVMGIGEPLLNYSSLTAALEVVTGEVGLGARKITVSSVGFPERLHRAARSEPRFQLAISLHSPFDGERDELVPAMRGTPIEEVLEAGDDWFQVTGREVTYEYVLLGGTNDDLEHADALARRLRGRRCTVNLIPYNPTPELPYLRPDRGRPEAFRERLEEAGIVATVRWSRGLEGTAACGQLRAGARST